MATTTVPDEIAVLGALLEDTQVALDGREAPARAREGVRQAMNAQDEELIDAAVLVTSELVANACLHTRGATRVDIALYERGVALHVHSRGQDPAFLRCYRTPVCNRARKCPPGHDVPESGRGLRIVDALTRAWHVEATGEDTVVTAVLARHPGSSAA